MGTIPPKELLTLWSRDDMPVEMAVGHILQNLAELQASTQANHLKIRRLQTVLESLIGKDGTTQKTTRHKKLSKE